ncbi:Nucleotidylyl transferase [Ascodesmis nigricans]|uniref:ethanolamine-phosphate cytidylyltransferase n=1 Tax=Ascodesmis nigricans TaxID=341454 RepID=A0A4S2N7N5_9PEZI|nr:Nucleotidylyl transferase [Ascodesmis nigricans]
MDPARIWVDGCFDFTHHGHSGAMLQAKKLGTHLVVGIHSDPAILANKGPTVMTLPERILAVSACRWSDEPVPNAPYVTDPAWLDAFGCKYVVHGDDLTTDSEGGDCYRIVKEAGRFKIVKRTPGISTTDLVGRMLVLSRNHHMHHRLQEVEEAELVRLRAYASDSAGVEGNGPPLLEIPRNAEGVKEHGLWDTVVAGVMPKEGQPIIYVDGGFDLFTPGHISVLSLITAAYKDQKPYLVLGLHSDTTINSHKGLNYPIMNLLERTLLVLQCRYVSAVIVNAPYTPTGEFLDQVSAKFGGKIEAVWHGPTKLGSGDEDTYKDAKERGIYREIEKHEWQHVSAGEIVNRILRERERYEERQRRKGVKMETFGG